MLELFGFRLQDVWAPPWDLWFLHDSQGPKWGCSSQMIFLTVFEDRWNIYYSPVLEDFPGHDDLKKVVVGE